MTRTKMNDYGWSGTVYPVASAWGQAYQTVNADVTVTVAGGGSGAGASRVYGTDTDSVHINDMVVIEGFKR